MQCSCSQPPSAAKCRVWLEVVRRGWTAGSHSQTSADSCTLGQDCPADLHFKPQTLLHISELQGKADAQMEPPT